jgi:hypothetical protein
MTSLQVDAQGLRGIFKSSYAGENQTPTLGWTGGSWTGIKELTNTTPASYERNVHRGQRSEPILLVVHKATAELCAVRPVEVNGTVAKPRPGPLPGPGHGLFLLLLSLKAFGLGATFK